MKKTCFILLLIVLISILTIGCAKNTTDKKAAALSIHMVQNGMIFDENWDIYKFAAEKNNITLKGTASKNNTDATQSFNLMVSSGDLPDIIGYVIAQIEKLGQDGGMIDLTGLIDKYAPNIKNFMTEHPRFAKDMYSLDGKIYVIPTFYDYENLKVAYGIFIRTDWLKKFNLKTPTTIREFEQVLTTLINNDANGNGKKDEIGIFARGPNGAVDALRYSAGILGALPYNTYTVENGKVVFVPLQKDFKPAIATMADWYKKGLVDKELFTRGGTAREQVLPTNLGIATLDWFPSTGAFNASIKDIPGFEFMPIPPLKDDSGRIVSKSLGRNTTNGWGWGISSKCKDPVTAIKFMDWWFSEEGRRAWNWGIEGKHYTMIDDKLQFTDYVLKNPNGLGPLSVLYLAGAQVSAIGVWQDAEYEKAWASEVAKIGWDMYMQDGFIIDDLPILKFSQENQTEIARIMTAINQTTGEYVQKWILGASNINNDWDTYVKRIKDQGIDRAMVMYQEAFDRFNEN